MKLRKSHQSLKFGGMMQITMKRITLCNGHTKLMFAFSDLGRWKVLSFSEHLVYDARLELGRNFRDLDGGETSPGWSSDTNIWTWIWVICNLQPRWRWDMNIGTGMELRIELDGGEMHICAPKWRWDGTQVSHDLDSYETGPGWRWDAHFLNLVGFEMIPG